MGIITLVVLSVFLILYAIISSIFDAIKANNDEEYHIKLSKLGFKQKQIDKETEKVLSNYDNTWPPYKVDIRDGKIYNRLFFFMALSVIIYDCYDFFYKDNFSKQAQEYLLELVVAFAITALTSWRIRLWTLRGIIFNKVHLEMSKNFENNIDDKVNEFVSKKRQS